MFLNFHRHQRFTINLPRPSLITVRCTSVASSYLDQLEHSSFIWKVLLLSFLNVWHNSREKARNAVLIIKMQGNSTYITDPSTPGQEPRKFAFDYSYWSHDGFKERDNGYLEPVEPQYADQVRLLMMIILIKSNNVFFWLFKNWIMPSTRFSIQRIMEWFPSLTHLVGSDLSSR